jgi:Flp pilus assembly protein TadG
MKSWSRRVRDERGSSLIEFSWLTILFIVPMIWLVVALFEVQSAAYGVTAAAREAGRAFVLSPDVATANARARQAAALALQDMQVPVTSGNLDLTAEAVNGAFLQPGSSVRITVRYSVALPFVPDVLGGPIASVPVKSIHTTPYGEYRQGAG